jgi:Xaa-Pro aminopeptidase
MNDTDVQRLHRAMRNLRERYGTETFLVTNLNNIRYLTGFEGSHAVLGIFGHHVILATDERYVLQVHGLSPEYEVIINRSSLEAVTARIMELAELRGGVGLEIGIESEHLSVAKFSKISESLGVQARLLETTGVIEDLRAVKDAREVELLREACEISTVALESVVPTIRIGESETSIARRLETAMLLMGADGIAFETIVASGPHSAQPHHRPCDRPISRGDLLVIDFGAKVGGYRSDQTRTFAVGSVSDAAVLMHSAVASAAEVARSMIRSGVDTRALDEAARGTLADHSLGEWFTHGLGHGVGLDVHEAPMISSRSTGMLSDGSVVTIEPGVYVPDVGGVRIEDCCVALESGVDVLTTASRELLSIGV